MNDAARRRPFRLFLDAADPAVWRDLLPTGVFHGVTTNPLLLRRAGLPCRVETLVELASRARDAGAAEIHLQTWGETVDELDDRGRELTAAADGIDVVVKVPATGIGFAAARRLVVAGRRVTLTAVFAPGQVLAAAALGADYAAPYLGRLDDAGRDGHAVVRAMARIVAGRPPLRLLVASLRAPEDVVDLAGAGLDTFTLGEQVAAALLREPLTDRAAAAFAEAAGAAPGEEP